MNDDLISSPDDLTPSDIARSRKAAIGDFRAMRLYRWLDMGGEHCRASAQRDHPREIDLLLRGIELRSRPFMPGGQINFGQPVEIPKQRHEKLSMEFRLGQLLLSVSTAKVALDVLWTARTLKA